MNEELTKAHVVHMLKFRNEIMSKFKERGISDYTYVKDVLMRVAEIINALKSKIRVYTWLDSFCTSSQRENIERGLHYITIYTDIRLYTVTESTIDTYKKIGIAKSDIDLYFKRLQKICVEFDKLEKDLMFKFKTGKMYSLSTEYIDYLTKEVYAIENGFGKQLSKTYLRDFDVDLDYILKNNYN